MGKMQLEKDPYSIVITGVGGQGNVLGSRVLSNMLVRKGYFVTIGETFGASQRGGCNESCQGFNQVHLESSDT